MTDQETMDGIAEYRALRSIMDNLMPRSMAQVKEVLGEVLFKRMEYLSKATWPARNERFKEFNDARL